MRHFEPMQSSSFPIENLGSHVLLVITTRNFQTLNIYIKAVGFFRLWRLLLVNHFYCLECYCATYISMSFFLIYDKNTNLAFPNGIIYGFGIK